MKGKLGSTDTLRATPDPVKITPEGAIAGQH
jgi:hypothetical protein